MSLHVIITITVNEVNYLLVNYQYRAYPDINQKLQLNNWLRVCQYWYNKQLGDRFDWWENNRNSINACPLICSLPELRNNPVFYYHKKPLPIIKEDLVKVVHSGELLDFNRGKPGRCQYLFSIPNCTNAALKSRRIRTRVKDEALEIRYAGMMSVLPPSVHPQTGQYRWVRDCSLVECAIAIAPQWLTQLMHKELPEKSTPKLQQTLQQSSGVKNDRIAALLAQINPWRADDYREWIRIGMALYSHSPTLLYLWDEWSRQSNKYQPGECERKWNTFNPNRITLGTLYYLAQIDSGSPAA